jgi:multidrug resistance efflux pump
METFVRRAAIKWTYLLGLLSFLAWLGNSFAGGYIYPRGEGMVIGEPAVVAAEFNATIREVLVKEGQVVSKADVVLHITSQYMAESRARLTAESAQRYAKLAELQVRSEVINATLGSAETREQAASQGQGQLDTLFQKGYLPAIARTVAAEQAYRGKQDVESLRAEQRALSAQIGQLSRASEQADSALAESLALFNNGQMRSPIKGTVSNVLVSPGAVIRAGDPMLEIVGEHRFVIAWFPVGRLFASQGYDLAIGRSVSVDPGNGSIPGKIAKISTVAGALPREFQKSFAPTERQQFIWIELDKNVTPPPYFTKVRIL